MTTTIKLDKADNATARAFEVTARAIAKAEGTIAATLEALGALLKPFHVAAITMEDGTVKAAHLTREVRPFRSRWIAAYAAAKGIDVEDDATRQAWSRYSRAALAGDKSLEGTQSRKPVRAAGSKTEPVSSGPTPGAVLAANQAGAPQEPDLEFGPAPGEPASQPATAPNIPVSHRQRLALVVNEMRAEIGALGEVVGGIDAKVKGRAELLAAFNRVADMARELEKVAVKVLSA